MTTEGPARTLRRGLDALASRTLSFWVMGAWIALAVVWLIPFQLTGQPDATLEGIATRWLPFRIVYAELLVTTLVCALARLRKDVRRARSSASLERPLPERPAARVSGTLDATAEALTALGFRVRHGDDRVLGVRRPWSLVGGALFHLGLPLLAAGLLVHAVTAGSLNFRLIEGQRTDPMLAKASGTGSWRPLRSSAASLTLESVQPEYFGDVLLFSRLEARFRGRDGSAHDLSLASPMWLDPFTMISIQDFGVAPRFQVLGPGGTVAEDVVTDMSIFPPGNQDSAQLPLTGYLVTLKLYPDHGVVAGRDVSLSYNLRAPRMLMGVERTEPAGVLIDRRLVAPGEPIADGSRAVLVKELRRYGEFRVWRSYGMPIVLLAGLLLTAGLAVRFLIPREDVVAWEDAGGIALMARVDGRAASGARPLLDRIATAVAEERGGRTPRKAAPPARPEGFAEADDDAFEQRESS